MTGTSERTFTTERWAYAGVRVGDGDKPSQAWRDPADGIVRTWGKRFYGRVGALYDVEVARDGEPGRVWRRGDPVPAGETYDHPQQVAEWEIASEAAERRLARAAAERRLKREGGRLDDACRDLVEIAAGLKSFNDVDMLVNSVRTRLYDAWGKR